MPLFGLCYGGSCCVYAISRICRLFKKKQRDKNKELLKNEQPLSSDSAVRFSALNQDRRPPSGGSGDRQDEIRPIEIVYNPPTRLSPQPKSASIRVTALMEIPPRQTLSENNNSLNDSDGENAKENKEMDHKFDKNEDTEEESERKQPDGKQDSPQFEKSISRNSTQIESADKNPTENKKNNEEKEPVEEEKKEDVKRSALLRRALRDARKRRRDGANSSMEVRRMETPQNRPKTTMGRRRSPLPPICNNKTAPANNDEDEDDFVNKRPPPRTFLATANGGCRTPIDPRLVQNQSRQEDDVEDTGEAQILYVEPREDPPNKKSIDDILRSKNAKSSNKKRRILAA